MRAKLIENQNFERGQDPKETMRIGLPVPSTDDILELLVADEKWEEIEGFVNENLLDIIYKKYPKAKPEDAMKAIMTVIEENLDNWYQTAAPE